MRRFALPAAVLAGVLLLTACGNDSTDGGRPVPVVDPSTSSSPSSTPTGSPAEPTDAPSKSAGKPTTGKPALVVVDPGNYKANPAVQGLVHSYPLYFKALVAKDDTILKKSFPSFWYADTQQAIVDAKRNGWVMRPPGGVVVLGVKNTSDGLAVVTTCRSQSTEYWDPKTKNWTVPAPKGSPQVIEMIRTGVGWLPYRLASSKGVNCANVHYPA